VLISALCVDIDQALQAHPEARMRVVQIKEKLGSLRFYYRLERASREIDEAVSQLVDGATKKSREICEGCGVSGSSSGVALMTGWRWMKTMCPACVKVREARDPDLRRPPRERARISRLEK
jgi:hypothetical protein